MGYLRSREIRKIRRHSGVSWGHMNNTRPDMVAELDILLSSAEVQDAWETERSLSSLPNVVFTAEGYRVNMHVLDQGTLPGIQEMKRSFTIAMHRKGPFSRCKIRWLT